MQCHFPGPGKKLEESRENFGTWPEEDMVPSAETPRAIQPVTWASILAKRVAFLKIKMR